MLIILLLIFNPVSLFITYVIYTKLNQRNWPFYVFIFPAVIIDIVVNLTWFTLIFADIPQELLLTRRIERLKKKDGYRGWLAKIGCRILNYFEKDHCL